MRKAVASPVEPRTGAPASERWLLLAIGLGTTLAPLNSTMIAVALPNIQSDLDASVSQTALLVTLYLVAMAVGQPIGGRLGDLVGRRRVYLIGLIWFGLASAACALAPNLAVLIVFRTQQAMAGALTFPNGAAMVRQAVPSERRGSAFGAVGMMTALAAAVGPPLGGLLVHTFDWRAIFWVNVPIIALALWLNARYLPASKQAAQARTPFDWLGSVLFGLTLTTFIAIPTMVRDGQVAVAVAAGVCSIGLGALFVRWELRQAHPVVDMRLFRERAFSASCSSIALSNFVMYTTLLALPLFMDHVRGDNEQTIGLTLAALSALSALWGLLGGRISDSRGRWLPAVAGAVGLLLGVAALAAVLDLPELWPVAAALGIMGVGLGVQSAPVQTAAIEAAPMEKSGSAAGVYSTSRYMGSVIGATILAIVFSGDPLPGDTGRFQLLFVGLALAALAGIFANNRIAPRPEPTIPAPAA
jgi:DHA2 family methylenomycin A resistance protein-like MFS transporter